MNRPPGVSATAFTSALARWRDIVTPAWVLTSDEDLHTYRDAYSPFWGASQELKASAAVAPASADEVQAVVRVAHELRIPIYPVSTGRNLGYGGSAPNYSGSVVVDLKRMNRILKVDTERHFVLVEPGVSYFDLYRHLRENDIPLVVDCPETGWGSLIGNALDHGLGYTTTSMRDHFGQHCGLEVVMPDGTLLRTGTGAAPKADTWQDYRKSFGPSLDGLFAQSNLGIVTKMGFWLQPMPEAVTGCDIIAHRYEDIVPLTALLNELENGGIADGMPWISSPAMGAPGAPPDPKLQAIMGREGGALRVDLEAYSAGKPYWQLRLRFFGPRKVNLAKWEHVRERAEKVIKGVRFAEPQHHAMPLTEPQAAALPFGMDGDRRVNLGYPNLEIFSLSSRSPINPLGARGHAWLSPIFPRTGEEVMRMQNMLTRRMTELAVRSFSNVPLPMTHLPRSYMTIIPFLISDDPKANDDTRDKFARMIDTCASQGWMEYRVHPYWQDKVRGYFDFNDHALLRVTERIKDAVDPNGILAAGRYGIWPKHLRGRKK